VTSEDLIQAYRTAILTRERHIGRPGTRQAVEEAHVALLDALQERRS